MLYISKVTTMTNIQAEFILSTPELRDDLPFFSETLGMRLESIFPADDPTVAVFSGHGIRLRLERGFEHPPGKIKIFTEDRHSFAGILIGKNGLLTPDLIRNVNPAMKIGVISGIVEGNELCKYDIDYIPKDIRPFGFMSYQAYDLGPRPVLELFAAGLKVGETMARARLSGMNVEQAAEHSIKNSWAQDLLGELSWLN